MRRYKLKSNLLCIEMIAAFLLLAVFCATAIAISPPPIAIIEIEDVDIVSGDSNGNGKIESNQTGVFKVSLRNNAYSLDHVYGVTSRIYSDTSNVYITDSFSSYGKIVVGSSKDPVDDGFSFEVDDQFSGSVTFDLKVSYRD